MRSSTKRLNIVELKKIKYLSSYITSDCFVGLDIDNTLAEISEEFEDLGSDQWFTELMKYAAKLDLKNENAVHLVLHIYHAVHHHVALKTVEKETAEVIKIHQDKKICMLGITSRSHEIMEPTHTQLKKAGIDFSRQWGCSTFALESKNPNAHPVYHHGIIFCDGANKDECLDSFLEIIGHKPKKMIILDDKQGHLVSIGQLAAKRRAFFVGLRYSYLDKKLSQLDMKKTQKQLGKLFSLFPEKTQLAIKKLKLDMPEESKKQAERKKEVIVQSPSLKA